MKKVLFAALCLLLAVSCKNEKAPNEATATMAPNDSLQRIIDAKDNEINDMVGILNDVQDGFSAISEAENRVSVMQAGEGANKKEQIRESIHFIQQRMAQNRELIAKLNQRVKEGNLKSDELKRTIENMMKQMEEKNSQLKELQAELEAKNIHIAELDETINTLNSDVTSLKETNTQKEETISAQDKQLNTAWYVFGTKKELKEHNVLMKGKILQGNFQKSYFTKIDIRKVKEIKLYSKSAKILTMHPTSSYTLQPDNAGQYVLRIGNPEIFWSTSKYLVMQVR